MTEDERVLARMAALEAEVRAETEVAKVEKDRAARRAEAIARLKRERAAKNAAAEAAARGEVAPVPAAKPTPAPVKTAPAKVALAKVAPAKVAVKPAAPADDADDYTDDNSDPLGDLSSAVALARKASDVKQELIRAPEEDEKSWLISGGVSLMFGPIGWLYAGSWRESIPATAAWVGVAAVASKILPTFLLMPAMLVLMPVSAIIGVMYSVKYNRAGRRQRVFGDNPPPKAKKTKNNTKALEPGKTKRRR